MPSPRGYCVRRYPFEREVSRNALDFQSARSRHRHSLRSRPGQSPQIEALQRCQAAIHFTCLSSPKRLRPPYHHNRPAWHRFANGKPGDSSTRHEQRHCWMSFADASTPFHEALAHSSTAALSHGFRKCEIPYRTPSIHARHALQFLPHPLLQLRRSEHLRLAAPAQYPAGDFLQAGQIRLKLDHAAIGFVLQNGLERAEMTAKKVELL